MLFATEMWERFSFYSMLAMFTLYLQDPRRASAGRRRRPRRVYSNYLMFVYCSPLIGGWIADRKLGYRQAVMIGGLFFMAGHLLLAFRSMTVLYAALACLVIGNGFFKPNVSTMVGKLYPEGSPLKDRAYNIFYMGINVGAFLAPIVMEVVRQQFGYHPAFAVAAGGMVISVFVLWKFKRHVEHVDVRPGPSHPGPGRPHHGGCAAPDRTPGRGPPAPATAWGKYATDVAARAARWKGSPSESASSRCIVVFLIVIVFWMAVPPERQPPGPTGPTTTPPGSRRGSSRSS